MLEILILGACLVLLCCYCIKGNKFEWYESIIFITGVLVFISKIENFYK